MSRVSSASVHVGGELVGDLGGPGLLVLLGVRVDDTDAEADKMADKLHGLRILPPARPGGAEQSTASAGTGMLIVSQFTLYGDTSKGRRPSWSAAAPAAHAEPLVARVISALSDRGVPVAQGRFGAEMAVSSVGDGPFTVLVEVTRGG